MARVLGLDKAVGAFVLYSALTVANTWPLALGLTRDVPGDLGDPLLNCWIIAWNAERLLGLLAGDLGSFALLWHGNVFYPAPYTLAYSELLYAQTLQALPVYALTHNPILCYNLLFLSTFVLSGLGMYLFVRELTGDWRAGLMAGLAFGFLPYRMDQLPHIQTLSAQWMPFALYGLRRYFTTGRLRPLAGATLALVAQNLSCGYFLIYFSLFVPPYVLWEMAVRRQLLDAKTWRHLLGAAGVVGAATLAAMYPYLAVREIEPITRTLDEVRSFSPDLLGYVTASDRLALWGWLQAMPKPEGAIFLGAASVAVILVALPVVVAAARRDAQAEATHQPPGGSRRAWQRVRRVAAAIALVVALGSLAAVLFIVIAGPRRFDLGFDDLKLLSVRRPLRALALSVVALLLLSRRIRSGAGALFRQPFVFFGACTIAAAWLALGPVVSVQGLERGSSYFFPMLYRTIPGFDGLRVPGRFAMVAGCFLAVTAGVGAHALLCRWQRRTRLVAVLLAVAAFADGAISPPLTINGPMHADFGLFHPPRQVAAGSEAPQVYHEVSRLQGPVVLLELPLGDVAWDIRSTFYSTLHWKPLVNGFSGYIPARYRRLGGALVRPTRSPDRTWETLAASGATHVVLHRDAFSAGTSADTAALLRSRGAVRLWANESDELYAMPRR